VFTRTGSTWTQQTATKLTGSGGSADPQFGDAVALSADGDTALIGGNYNVSGGKQGAAWRRRAAAGRPARAQPCETLPAQRSRRWVAEPRAARQAAVPVGQASTEPTCLREIRPLDPGFGPAISR
jgi:hypothetical protein